MLKSEKGVTLVALVVTIIVLIILASVSIVTVVGQNGVWEQAQQARDMAINAQKETDQTLQTMYDIAQNIIERENGSNR